MGRFALVMAVTTGAGIVTALGVWSVYYRQDWAIRNSTYFMSFAAGILVALPFLRLIPTSTSEIESAPLFLLGGFLLMLGSRRVFHLYHAEEETDEAEHALIGVIPLVGIAFHSFIGGIVHAVAFTFSIVTGAVLAAGMVLHEFPEGIVTFVLLREGGYARKKAAVYAILGAGLSTPLGALIAYPFVSPLSDAPLAALLAAAAGVLLYVGATHLLPLVERRRRRWGSLPFLAGVALVEVLELIRGVQ